MSRPIYSRIQINGLIDVRRTLHVGGMHLDSTIDLTLAVNGKGEVYIPGTSLAGALRAWTEQAFQSEKAICRLLWGYQETDKKAVRGKDEQASAIVVEDAVVRLQNGEVMQSYHMEVRDGIGIDRHLGSTVENFQYTRGVIPRGATFPLVLSVDCLSKDTPHETEETAQKSYNVLNALLTALVEGEIRLGGAKSRGLGWITLRSDFKRIEHHLNSQQGILEALRGTSAEYNYTKTSVAANSKLKLTLEWQPLGSLMVKSEQSGVAVDILPLMGSDGKGQLGFVLPGSSVKGAVRSQAERIIRTLLSGNTINNDSTQKFTQQMDLPLVNSLFGTAAKTNDDEKADWLPGLAALSIEDCYSKKSCSSNDWQQVVNANKETDLSPILKSIEIGDVQQAFHVAIDRWTGGAADQMLYTAIEPFGLVWEPLYLNLNFDRVDTSEWDAALALLLILLRDMEERRIALGYGTNRGMGSMQLKSVAFEGVGHLSKLAQKVVQKGLPNGKLADLGNELLMDLTTAWISWIDAKKEGE